MGHGFLFLRWVWHSHGLGRGQPDASEPRHIPQPVLWPEGLLAELVRCGRVNCTMGQYRKEAGQGTIHISLCL